MRTIEISEDTYRKPKAFTKVIDAILKEGLESESRYFELAIFNGIEKMLQELFPKEELLPKTMINMFNENREFVSEFIVKMIKEGKILRQEEAGELKDEWSSYIT